MPVLTDPHGWFVLEVPEGWAGDTDDGVTTLKSPRGIGTVFLCGARHARGRQASFGRADFLMRFLHSIGLAVRVEEIGRVAGTACGTFSYAREVDGTAWRYFSITDDETALLLTYACPASEAAVEADTVDAIVRSVRLYHSAPVH